MKDKHELNRFSGTCPTCHQPFMLEAHEQLLRALKAIAPGLLVGRHTPADIEAVHAAIAASTADSTS